ncbi:hypothetical protein NL676_032252 [Syzygium grande]|nr:hypothetical protein NL676_032252 [Syzygium grande]
MSPVLATQADARPRSAYDSLDDEPCDDAGLSRGRAVPFAEAAAAPRLPRRRRPVVEAGRRIMKIKNPDEYSDQRQENFPEIFFPLLASAGGGGQSNNGQRLSSRFADHYREKREGQTRNEEEEGMEEQGKRSRRRNEGWGGVGGTEKLKAEEQWNRMMGGEYVLERERGREGRGGVGCGVTEMPLVFWTRKYLERTSVDPEVAPGRHVV